MIGGGVLIVYVGVFCLKRVWVSCISCVRASMVALLLFASGVDIAYTSN